MDEVIFASSVPQEAYEIQKKLKKKEIRKIAPRIYTCNFEDKPEEIIKKYIYRILSELYPQTLLSHRTAFEVKPTPSNKIFLTHTYTKKIKLPGVTLQFIEGKGPLDDDIRVIGNLYASGKERALLENLQISKRQGNDSKTLPFKELEKKLIKISSVYGKDELKAVQEKAKILSVELNMQREYRLLEKMISEILNSEITGSGEEPFILNQ